MLIKRKATKQSECMLYRRENVYGVIASIGDGEMVRDEKV